MEVSKKEYRKEYYRRFREQSQESLLRQHKKLGERVWFFFKRTLSSNKSRILIYRSFSSEIPVSKLLERSPALLFYPVFLGNKLLARRERLYLPLFQMDLIIVPCLLFNSAGYRLGRGGGFYDRSLRFIDKHKLLLLVRHWQKEENIPIAEHDIPIPLWISDEEISYFVKF